MPVLDGTGAGILDTGIKFSLDCMSLVPQLCGPGVPFILFNNYM